MLMEVVSPRMMAKIDEWNQLRISSARKPILYERLKCETLLLHVCLIHLHVSWISFLSGTSIRARRWLNTKDGSDVIEWLVVAESIQREWAWTIS